MQRLAPFPLAFLASIVLLASLAACSSALPLSPSPILSPSASPSPSPTSTPEVTKTPEPAKPAVAYNLSPQNAASETYENGAWVVKNAAGAVTATWDSAKGEWTYNYENIQRVISIVGNTSLELREINVPSEITDYLPDDPAKHLVNASGLVEDGTMKTFNVEFISTEVEGKLIDQIYYVAARIWGVVPWTYKTCTGSAIFFEVRVTPDKSLYFYKLLGGKDIFTYINIPDNNLDLFDASNNTKDESGMTEDELIQLLGSNEAIGAQVSIPIVIYIPKMPDAQKYDSQAEAIIQALTQRTMPNIDLSYYYIIQRDIGLPQSLIE